MYIHSRLSRCGTARGSCAGFSLGSPTKVKSHKFFLFTEDSLKVESKEHLFDFVVTLYLQQNLAPEHTILPQLFNYLYSCTISLILKYLQLLFREINRMIETSYELLND